MVQVNNQIASIAVQLAAVPRVQSIIRPRPFVRNLPVFRFFHRNVGETYRKLEAATRNYSYSKC
jgi:hypothetical protein